jgi:hypothetical protein
MEEFRSGSVQIITDPDPGGPKRLQNTDEKEAGKDMLHKAHKRWMNGREHDV